MLSSKSKRLFLLLGFFAMSSLLSPARTYADEVNSWGGGSGTFDANKAAEQRAAEAKRKAKRQKRLEEQKAAEEKKAAEASGGSTETK